MTLVTIADAPLSPAFYLVGSIMLEPPKKPQASAWMSSSTTDEIGHANVQSDTLAGKPSLTGTIPSAASLKVADETEVEVDRAVTELQARGAMPVASTRTLLLASVVDVSHGYPQEEGGCDPRRVPARDAVGWGRCGQDGARVDEETNYYLQCKVM
ncbi:hypothetical protein GMORB2_0719 [Geosmithia morbida]|uniref:Uncharacterized protein n=1 Tax=Geosmithia morbida TaxID=1094350 RepID=A0A9P4Z1I6_9HYPO|nr:uncharacterized protein GMORB2_0719 [Geosmithia morbida]KAF4126981.1 hypothetical protein GMORB2_0719 [Geosmithia morbida]